MDKFRFFDENSYEKINSCFAIYFWHVLHRTKGAKQVVK
jgi:hypothetical protein